MFACSKCRRWLRARLSSLCCVCVCVCVVLTLFLLLSHSTHHTHHTDVSHTGRAAECEALYRQALLLCPTYPSAHYNLGVLASEARRWLDALKHYQDTLALSPHHAQVIHNRLAAAAAAVADLDSCGGWLQGFIVVS